MPLPKPKKGETEKKFISRCMGDGVMNREYPKLAQRYRVCQTQWDDRKKANAEGETMKPDISALVDKDFLFAADGEATQSKSGKTVKVTILAYSGGFMKVRILPLPILVELSGMQLSDELPILADHDETLDGILGQGSPDIRRGRLIVTGRIHSAGAKNQRIIGLSKFGFKFQASIGAEIVKIKYLEAGATVEANGRTHKVPVGGAYHVTRSKLKEVSILGLGADDRTSVDIAAASAAKTAANAVNFLEDGAMKPFEEYVKASGFDPDNLSEAQDKFLRAAYDAEKARVEAESASKPPVVDPPAVKPAAAPVVQASASVDLEKVKADAKAAAKVASGEEFARVSAINAFKAGDFAGLDEPKLVEIKAQAVKEDWTPDKAELELVRAARPTAPNVASFGHAPASSAILTAALCLTAGLPGEDLIKNKDFDEQTVEAADSEFRGLGIQQLMVECCLAEGIAMPRVFGEDTIRAAFTTTGLSGILGTTANKTLLKAYAAIDSVARRVFSESDVKDFKVHTRYRMISGGHYKEVGADGMLNHGELSEDSYTQQIATFGEIIALTRQMIINDDLHAFLQIPRMLGREAALALEEAAFTVLMANAGGFFAAGHSNYETGAGTALQVSSLTAAEKLFIEQTDSKGKPIHLMPAILLTPPALKVTGEQLMTSLKLFGSTTADKGKPSDNPHAGKFRPECSPYLSNSGLTGYSSLAWYLLGDPADVAAIEIAYLTGKRQPTIETGNVDFNQLGIYYRSFFDFGVAQQDYRAAVKEKGEA